MPPSPSAPVPPHPAPDDVDPAPDSRPAARPPRPPPSSDFVAQDGPRRPARRDTSLDPANDTPRARPRRRRSELPPDHAFASAPLSPPRDPELFQTEDEWRTFHHRESLDGWHNLPLFLVALPPLGAIVHGRAENWADGIILVLTAFYLYQLIKVPWQIYYASHARYVIDGSLPASGPGGPGGPEYDADPSGTARRRERAAAGLRRNELLSLAMTMVVPALGASLLHYVRGLLSDPDRYINNTIITLFGLATAVKPLLHFGKLVKHKSLYYQEAVWYPSTEVHFLRRRVELLEKDISQLARGFATKDDVRLLRDGVDVPLSQLSKAVRRFDRKEEYLRLSTEERFALLDAKLDEAARDFSAQGELLDRLRQDQDRVVAHPLSTLLHVLGHLLGSRTSSSTSTQGNQQQGVRWYERGPLMLVFWPVSVSHLALEWVSNKAEAEAEAVAAGPNIKLMKAG